MPFEHWWAWGINHLCRKPVPVLSVPLKIYTSYILGNNFCPTTAALAFAPLTLACQHKVFGSASSAPDSNWFSSLTVQGERTTRQEDQIWRSAGIKKCSGQKVNLNLAAFKCVSQTAPNPFPWQLQYSLSPRSFSMHQAMEHARRHLFIAVAGQMRAMLN